MSLFDWFMAGICLAAVVAAVASFIDLTRWAHYDEQDADERPFPDWKTP